MIVKKAGKASVKSSKSILATAPTISTPTIINAGAVASAGINLGLQRSIVLFELKKLFHHHPPSLKFALFLEITLTYLPFVAINHLPDANK